MPHPTEQAIVDTVAALQHRLSLSTIPADVTYQADPAGGWRIVVGAGGHRFVPGGVLMRELVVTCQSDGRWWWHMPGGQADSGPQLVLDDWAQAGFDAAPNDVAGFVYDHLSRW